MFPSLLFLMSLKDLGNPIINHLDQEVRVEASISGLPSESYFRVEWQKSPGDNYFGVMKVGDNWVTVNSAQDCKNYLNVTDTNTTSLSFVTKIGEDKKPSDGNYNIKIRRYTSSCASYSDSESIGVTLNLPTSSPTPTPSPSPSAKPISTPVPVKTQTPSPVVPIVPIVPLVVSSSPVAKVIFTPIASKMPLESTSTSLQSDILGVNDVTGNKTLGAISTKSADPQNKNKMIAFSMIGFGVVFILIALIVGFRLSKNSNISG
jgi:hypothetical protein